ncbi:MAG: MetS family NSS transporter small subunit [Thermoplasmatota archaeon]
MPASAIAMFIIGCTVFYGGLAWCLYIALKKRSP